MIETSGPIHYRRIKSGGYQLIDDWWCKTPIIMAAARVEDYVTLNTSGVLTVHARYRWDGPSGPSIDTPSFMRGSLAHDALYQLLRAGKLHPQNRIVADQVLRDLCEQDGMPWWRRAYVYRMLRLFAGGAAARQHEVEELDLVAP